MAWSADPNIPLKHSREYIQELPHLQFVPFLDIDRRKISVLLGTNVIEAFVPIDVRKGLPTQPLAIKTVLGWSILGRSSDPCSNSYVNCTCREDSILDERIKKFWEIKSYGTEKSSTKPRSIEDNNAMKIIEETISKIEGHYQMGLLWREQHVQLPYNKSLAEARLHHLKKRLKGDLLLKSKYQAVIKDYVNKGYAKKLSPEEASKKSNITWYLPHHPVVNPNKPGKVRVVFDAAAKFNGTSLNDQLMQGPDLTNDLVGLLMRF